MGSNNGSYQPWPQEGHSWDIGSTTVMLAATSIAALGVRLYVALLHKREISVVAATLTLVSSHVLMLAQSGLIVAAAYYGWGTSIDALPESNIRKAEQLFFASNILLVLVHGFSRTSISITLWRTCDGTSIPKLAIAIASLVPVWVIGSILGITIQRVNGPSYWVPVGEDCSFTLWAVIYLFGFGIDVAIASCAAVIIVPLNMQTTTKVYTIFVFAVGILVIVPVAVGLAHLKQDETRISDNPTLYSFTFIYANQAAIAVTLWCRIWEAARTLQKDMGYASYGLPNFSVSDYARGTTRRRNEYYAGGSKPQSHGNYHNSAAKRSLSEDEVQLRPDDQTYHIAKVERGATSSQGFHGLEGIDIRREYGYIEEDAPSDK